MLMIPLNKLLHLSGKTAIVTGGGRGIGYGIAYRLAEAGANVVIADLKNELVEESTQKLKQNKWSILGIQCDVSSSTDVQKTVNSAVSKFGGLHILVNNAGIYPSKMVMEMTEEDFNKVLAINLKGVFLFTKLASEQMIKQGTGGKVINITSIDALHPSMPGLAHYDASKHGVWGFTKNVALELAPHKIWVNAIAPGGIATPGVAETQKPRGDQGKMSINDPIAAFMSQIPMRRMGEIDDIGKVALFLASDMSSYMTGTQIVVDGGYLLS